jgi:hypothetical protein
MSKYPQGKYDRHPLNVTGPFYVEEGQCIECLGPCGLAPEFVGHMDEPPGMRGASHCYIKKQPATPEELDRMVEAMKTSLCSGLRYCGDDPVVLERLRKAGQAGKCDELSHEFDPGIAKKPSASGV